MSEYTAKQLGREISTLRGGHHRLLNIQPFILYLPCWYEGFPRPVQMLLVVLLL